MNNKNPNLFENAKNYCLRLLKVRLRSEDEVSRRLKNKKFDEAITQQAIGFLKENRLINDDYFARVWIESRIKKPFGLKRLRDELRKKGIDNRIIEANIGKIINNYSEEEVISRLIAQQLNKLKYIDLQTAKRRIYGYLIRRGFSPETIIDAINKIGRS